MSKSPVDPQLMRAMQLKREAGIKLAIWAVAVLALIAAGIGVLTLAYMLGGSEALAATAGVILATALLSSMGLMASELDSPVAEYLYRSRQLAELTNEIAWNSQQEELKRIQDLLKEENL